MFSGPMRVATQPRGSDFLLDSGARSTGATTRSSRRGRLLEENAPSCGVLDRWCWAGLGRSSPQVARGDVTNSADTSVLCHTCLRAPEWSSSVSSAAVVRRRATRLRLSGGSQRVSDGIFLPMIRSRSNGMARPYLDHRATFSLSTGLRALPSVSRSSSSAMRCEDLAVLSLEFGAGQSPAIQQDHRLRTRGPYQVKVIVELSPAASSAHLGWVLILPQPRRPRHSWCR